MVFKVDSKENHYTDAILRSQYLCAPLWQPLSYKGREFSRLRESGYIVRVQYKPVEVPDQDL